MKKERREILRKLMHKQEMGFNELWGNIGASNGFAYHLKILVEDGLVEKRGEKYCLTHEGKKYVTYVEGESGEKAKSPLVCVLIVVYDEVEKKFLMCERTKEPFYGYWGFVIGKIKFDQYIYETAKAELKEETGLECDLELKGLCSYKTYNNNKLGYNHQIFVVLGKNHRGKLIEKTREGENHWIKEGDASKLKAFPNALAPAEIARGKGFRWIEMDRFQEDDEFVGKKILRDEKF
jgi:ADP-ribose pyrophosphatase YjhB (NUDIX family)